jgi:hypothetical protein
MPWVAVLGVIYAVVVAAGFLAHLWWELRETEPGRDHPNGGGGHRPWSPDDSDTPRGGISPGPTDALDAPQSPTPAPRDSSLAR